MPLRVQDVVGFRGDRLFNGAVSIDWFTSDPVRARAAAEAFVFHGAEYHGVSQADVGTAHGHRLEDTASFARTVVRRCYGLEDQPFTLAIAGYGTGKSHLGVALATLLCNPGSAPAREVLAGLASADQAAAREIRAVMEEAGKPCLVVALNGMGKFDLTAEVSRQVVHQLRACKLGTTALDELRPRFRQAAKLIELSNDALRAALLEACEASGTRPILEALAQQDEVTYARVHDFFSKQGMPIRALGGESVRDVIDVCAREYCGPDKPFRSLVLLFDEFGKYTEFATVRSQIAGSGVLQDLFEAVQKNSGVACFVGFIQFELNVYVQRVGAEYKNEILRYVTRYQTAHRAYLSTNLETLIAHLFEKRGRQVLERWFGGSAARGTSQQVSRQLCTWFPQAHNHRLWTDDEQFHVVIRQGCWPLSPFATWTLYHLTASGKYLQERSALAHLGDTWERCQSRIVDDDGGWALAPVDLWSDALHKELITSEAEGSQGTIAHSYESVMARHGTRLEGDVTRVLRAVVLASKLGLQVGGREAAMTALAQLAGIPTGAVESAVRVLQEEYNVLEWVDAFKAFDILGDAVPRTQFLAFVRQRVASSYDEAGKARLFASKGLELCTTLGDLECDFAEENRISTREWRYQAVTSSLETLPMCLKLEANRWATACDVDQSRGTLVHCYVEPSCKPEAAAADAAKCVRAAARDIGVTGLPLLVVLLCDQDGKLGRAVAELAVLTDGVSQEDRARFGNLIGAHVERTQEAANQLVDAMVKERRYVTCFGEPLQSQRLSAAGLELFQKVYKSPLPFPFDGFTTAKGNAADTWQELVGALMVGKLDYDAVIAKPPKTKNRALTVLHETWGAFTKPGAVARRPGHAVVRAATERWDEALAAGERCLDVGQAIRQMCRPPYGANIASAGLLLGVFVAPRGETLQVARDGRLLAISDWVQDGLFRGKSLGLESLDGVKLVLVGESSSEWEALLDEWEQTKELDAQARCLERGHALRARVPVPSALAYRFVHLEAEGQKAAERLQKARTDEADALAKVKAGRELKDVERVSAGAVGIHELLERMTAEEGVWADADIARLRAAWAQAREQIKQLFPSWLGKQLPANGSVTSVAEFRQRMLDVLSVQLRKLSLDDLREALEEHTKRHLREAEAVADARQLHRDVESWLERHASGELSWSIAETRVLYEQSKAFASKLQGMAKRVELAELNDDRTRLAQFQARLKGKETALLGRLTKVKSAAPSSESDLRGLTDEVTALETALEGRDVEVRSLRVLHGMLDMYQVGLRRLQDERLTCAEFDALRHRLVLEAEAAWARSNEKACWPPDKVYTALTKAITASRVARSSEWITMLELQAAMAPAMQVEKVLELRSRALAPPAFVTAIDDGRRQAVVKALETRLNALKVDWLVEEFKKLPLGARKEFLTRVSQVK